MANSPSSDTVAVSRKLVAEAINIIRQTVSDCGGCDHSVGICMCHEIRAADNLANILATAVSGKHLHDNEVQPTKE